jgi:glycosyltransferase involved in cell wall biosynthesis
MNTEESDMTTLDVIHRRFNETQDAEECLELAAAAEAAGDAVLTRSCLERSIALDRFCQPALLNLAAIALGENDAIAAFSMLEEAARLLSPLTPEVEPLRQQLYVPVSSVPEMESYLRLTGRVSEPPADRVYSILIVTSCDMTVSAEPGSAGLTDLIHAFERRGHQVRLLTGSAVSATTGENPEAAGGPTTILRSLQYSATRVGSKLVAVADASARTRDNIHRLRAAVTKSGADFVLAFDLELLDVSVLRPALDRGVPVLHWMQSVRPGFTVDEQPRDANYWIVPVSEWTGTSLRNAGFETSRMETVYPGIDQNRFFRLFLPDTRRLRIGFSAALTATTGADTLVSALIELRKQAVDFTAEFAGDLSDREFVQRLQALIGEHRLEANVCFTSAVTTGDFAALLGRVNVLVVASTVPRTFDISLIQAMSSGVVVVSNGTGGSKEIVRHESDGLLFTPGNAVDLAAKLTSLSRDPELFSRLQRQGQARVSRFSSEVTASNFEKVASQMRDVLSENAL